MFDKVGSQINEIILDLERYVHSEHELLCNCDASCTISWKLQWFGNKCAYTHDVHDFDIHIFADEVDQVDHDKINGLYFSSLNKSLQYEHNTLW